MNYEIKGGNLPVVICELDKGETVISEGGGMSWMSDNMQMETIGGGMGKVFGRMFSGESAFQNQYTAVGGRGLIAFASSFPGSIKVFDITPSQEIILQKRSFLASEKGVQLSVHFNKVGAGFFGGEGFIMQRVSGNGKVFAEFDGHVEIYELGPGQKMVVDTGNLAACDGSVKIEVVAVKGLKNKLLGGEGFFNTVLTGPGKIYLQSMSLSNLASLLSPLVSAK